MDHAFNATTDSYQVPVRAGLKFMRNRHAGFTNFLHEPMEDAGFLMPHDSNSRGFSRMIR